MVGNSNKVTYDSDFHGLQSRQLLCESTLGQSRWALKAGPAQDLGRQPSPCAATSGIQASQARLRMCNSGLDGKSQCTLEVMRADGL